MSTERVAVGTLVDYHGSLEHYHGQYKVAAHTAPLYPEVAHKYVDGTAYSLEPVGEGLTQTLYNARRTSFTPAEVANPNRSKVL